ncbi:MAG TPA: hypothetical protein VNN79_10550, partial [Actinomycetota bacterium]|nr:hypothetical protein [Actinomycetota bacterium]
TIAGTDVGGADRLGLTFRWRGEQEGCAITPCLVIDRSGGLMAESLTRGRTALVDLRSRRRVATLPPMDGNDASALAFSPDGATLVTGGVDGTVTLWNVANRTPTNTLRIGDRVWWVAVSPDGRLLATQSEPDGASTSTVEVRTLEGGRIVFRGEVRDGKGGLSFSPDGRSLAALGCCVPGSTVVVWDTRTWEERYRPTVAGHADSLAFSPDGRFLGIGTEDGSVLLLDAGTGRPNGATIQAATGPINPLSFSPDGRLLVASSGDQTSTLWDVASRRRIGTTFPIEEAAIPVAVFTPAGDVLIDYLRDTSIWPTSLRRWEDFACGVAGRDLSPQEWNEILPDRPYRAVCPS